MSYNPTAEYIRPIVLDISKATLRKQFPYFDLCVDIQTRMEYLQKVKDYWRKSESKGSGVNPEALDDLEELAWRNEFFNTHMEYVRTALTRLDITHSIDHPTFLEKFGVPEWVPDSFHTVDEFNEFKREWKAYKEEYPAFVLDAYFGMPAPVITRNYDLTEQLLIKQTYQSRRAEYLQRLMNSVQQCHLDGWFFIFDTLTLAPDMVRDFSEATAPIRDYTRKVGRLVGRSLGRKAKDSTTDIYKYFCVPEYGDKNGRLHFHILHMCKALPPETHDPAAGCDNFGRPLSHRRELDSMKGLWQYGTSMPISVRYKGDAYTTKLRWCMPINKKTGKRLVLKPVIGVIYYISKYVSKNLDSQSQIKLKRNKEKWRKLIHEYKLPQTLDMFRVSYSQRLGMSLPSMQHLSMKELQMLTCLHWKVSNLNVIVRKNAREALASRLADVTCLDILQALPSQTNMLKLYRDLMSQTMSPNLLSFLQSGRQSLTDSDISDNVRAYLRSCNAYAPDLVNQNNVFSSL